MTQVLLVTLQNVLDSSSALLGETGGTPTAELTNRTRFANDCKKVLANMRNWGFEYKTGTPITITSSTTYSLPNDIKNDTSVDTIKITDTKSNVIYYPTLTRGQLQYDQANNITDNGYHVSGDPVAGFTLTINPTPSGSIVGGTITPGYFSYEGDFVNTTDTTRIPSVEVLSRYVVAKVLYGYREQAQYQLAMNEFNNALEDLASTDLKEAPHAQQKVLSFKESLGMSDNFKTFF